jgi:hypothetical protein
MVSGVHWLVLASLMLAVPTLAQTWGTLVNISDTMGVSANRVCIGEGSRQDIGCPTYAPSVSSGGLFTATSIATGGLTVTGATSLSTISATVGDFTTLRVGGVPVASGGGPLDRISSSNSQAMALATDGGTISFTLGGTAGRAYLHTTLGLVAPGVSTTGPISATSAFFAGQALSQAFNAGAATSFDWNNGNVQYTSANCGSFTFSNMRDGGHYNLVVTGASSATCTFTHTALTVRLPTGFGATTASTHTVFAFLRAGTNLYVTAVRGLN